MGNSFLAIAAVLLGTAPAFAIDLGLGIDPPARQRAVLRYSGVVEPKSGFAGEPGEIGILQTNVSGSLPVHRNERESVALSGRFNRLNLHPNPSSLGDLDDIQLGASYTRRIEEARMWAISAAFGSASDRPFRDSSVDTVSATALYSFAGSPTESWVVLLSYSNNRPILNNVPLPGFAYTYAPSRAFRGTFGFPFASLYWEFADGWNLTLFTVAPWVAKAQVAYALAGPIQVFAGIDFSQMTYLQYGRLDPRQRLYYDEKKAFVGLKSPLSQVVTAELEGGYAFDRRFFSATKSTSNPDNPTDLGATAYGRLGLSATF